MEAHLSSVTEMSVAGESKAPRLTKTLGWYVTFLLLAIGACLIVSAYTGLDIVAGTARFAWNILAVAANSILKLTGGFLALVAKGVGWRRLSRVSVSLTSVGLSYSGGLLLSEPHLAKARGWTGALKRAVAEARGRWLRLPLVGKCAVVATLIASQLYLHSVLIVFPIAFLVPVVRRIWVQTADLAFGKWYWKTLGHAHRAVVGGLRRMPVVREIIGGTRLVRLRYLCAWRLWKYDPRYRRIDGRTRRVSFIEPFRLWGRRELDRYVDRPLLGGRSSSENNGATSAAPAITGLS